MRKNPNPDIVSASEIGSYAFCPEAWRLSSGLNLEPKDQRELGEGEKTHEKTALLEERTESASQLGVLLLVLGVVLLGVCLFLVGR